MVTIKEFFNNIFSKTKAPIQAKSVESYQDGESWLQALSQGTIGGFASKFVTDIYKERVLYPHDEMQTAQKAYRYNSYINSAVRTRANFMLGGAIRVQSEDKATEEWLNEMLNETGLNRNPQFMGIDCTNTGNFYAERIRDQGKIVYYDYISHPERMYVAVDKSGLVDYYFQEVPERWDGTKFDTFKYYGDRKKSLKGIKLPKQKIFHVKLGVAEIPVYGRGPVCTLTNDVEILLAVERSMAVIAYYKGIPKKLVTLDRENQDANSAMKAAEAYANMISDLSDEENPVLPEKVNVEDLSYSGKDMNFQPFIDYLKKKITVALAPSFIVHGEETNYAVSRDQKEAWIKEIEAERSALGLQIKKELKLIAASHKKRVQDFEVIFGEFDLGQSEEKIDYATKAFQAGLITLNEARDIIGKEEDDELGDSYSNELQANAQLGGGGFGDDSDFREPSGEEGDEDEYSTEEPTVPLFESLKEKLPDGAVRLGDGQKPPEGAQVINGPKGGKYYVPSGDKKAPDDSETKVQEHKEPKIIKHSQKEMKAQKEAYFASMSEEQLAQIKDVEERYLNDDDTFNQHTGPDGKFTPERQKVHEKIFSKYNAFVEEATQSEKKVVFLAGLPASGKTSSTKERFKRLDKDGLLLQDADGHKYVVLNADDLKKQLPEYKGYNAAEVHEESSILNKHLVAFAIQNKASVVVDGVLSNADKADKLHSQFKDEGYKSSMLFVNVPGQESIKRAQARFEKKGRHVPPDIIIGSTDGVNKTVSSLWKKFDDFTQFDNF